MGSNRKILLLLLILILVSLGSVNAGNLCIDGYAGTYYTYRVTDLTTCELIWDRDVAAGDSHNKNIDDNHKLHQILIECDFHNSYNPGKISVIENVYNGIWINVYAEGFYRFAALDRWRVNRLTVEYGNYWKGNVYSQGFVLPA